MTALPAIIGLLISIVLILKKYNAVYSLFLGAFIGGLAGGLPVSQVIFYMIDGIKDVTPAIIRILTAGVLSGVLIRTGAASRIAIWLIDLLGENRSMFALAFSTMLLTAVGVFVDVAVITVSPIALAIGKRLRCSKVRILLAMIGGGKCGNVISPNPNTIVAAENFNVSLPSVMYSNLFPAIVGLLITAIVVKVLKNKGEMVVEDFGAKNDTGLPSIGGSLAGPIVAILLLSLRPLFNIIIDPLIALPVGGIVGIIAMSRTKQLKDSISYGLEKMSVVAVLLIGTGTIAGIIKNSALKNVILNGLEKMSISESLIAPLSGAIMSAATASTTAGATLASTSFANAILLAGVPALWGAAMINSGATVLDHLPHGSFFHATAGSVFMSTKERLRIIGYESVIGLSIAACSFVCCLIFSR